jgi:predicted regulator of Ras-like GTPase activity (Roadblock/LC7/MglB family)
VIEIIQPLASLPGVLVAGLVTDDGVPVAVPGAASGEGEAGAPWRDPDVLAAIAAAWTDDLERALGKLSWDAPRRAAMRAARGTLLVLPTSGALLVVVLEQGMQPDGLWLSMEGAAARIERMLRGMGDRIEASAPGEKNTDVEPPAPLPSGAAPGEASARVEELEEEPRTGDREQPADR